MLNLHLKLEKLGTTVVRVQWFSNIIPSCMQMLAIVFFFLIIIIFFYKIYVINDKGNMSVADS